MNIICFDLEGPLSPQDNAYEVTSLIDTGDASHSSAVATSRPRYLEFATNESTFRIVFMKLPQYSAYAVLSVKNGVSTQDMRTYTPLTVSHSSAGMPSRATNGLGASP